MIRIISGVSKFVGTPEGEKSVIFVRWVDDKGNYGVAHADSMFSEDVEKALNARRTNSIPRL